MSEHVVCAVVILALLAVNYGLTQRLIRQAGQPRMNPVAAIPDALMSDGVKGGKIEPTPRQILESFKITP